MSIRDFVPDLVLQGIVTDQKVHITTRNINAHQIKDDMVIKSMSPTTIVDLHQHTVKQTPPYNEYMVIRKDYQKVRPLALPSTQLTKEHSKRQAKVPTTGSLWGATEKLYRDVGPSELVADIISKYEFVSLSISP